MSESNGEMGDGENDPSQSTSSSPLSVSMRPVFLLLKMVGFYAHDPAVVPKAYESPLATLYVASLITVNIFLFAFNVCAVEKSVVDEGLWRVATTSLVIASIPPIHCAFNLALFRRGHVAHQFLWQQTSQIDQFFISRLQVIANCGRLKATFLVSTVAIFFIPACLSASQAAFSPNTTFIFTNPDWNVGECLVVIFAPIQCVWQLLPLLYYAHVGWLFLFWYRSLHTHVDTDWEDYGRRRRRPIEFYSRQYTKLTEAVFAAGQFFHPIIFFSLTHSTLVLCLGVYLMKNAGEDDWENGQAIRKAYSIAWTILQILIALAYVATLCFMRWQLKLRACMVAANILLYNRRTSKEYSSIRDASSALTDRRRQWRRRTRSERHQSMHERHNDRHQSEPETFVVQSSRQRFRRLTILSSPRPILPSVWSAASMTRKRENRGSTYL